MESTNPVVIDAPKDSATQEKKAEPKTASQGTYKITGPDGREYEFPGLAITEEGQITIASLIDLLLVLVSSLDNPTVDQILQANDIVQRDISGKLWYPRPRKREAAKQA